MTFRLVFHFDSFWMRAFEWCNFEWDSTVFDHPEEILKRYHERGLKLCVWINPYIAQNSALFDEAAEKGYLIRTADGSISCRQICGSPEWEKLILQTRMRQNGIKVSWNGL